MQTVQKEKIYSYAFRTVLSLILFYCLYNVVCILFLSPYNNGKLQLRVSSDVNAVGAIIKHAGPKKTEQKIYKSNLVNKTDDSSWASQIKRATVFAGSAKLWAVKAEETEEVIVQYEEGEITDDTEIIFKGLVDGLAYINVKKEIDGQWHEQGFATKIGDKIGDKKVIGGKTLDFTTDYVLQEIVYNAQKPVTLNKKVVDLNEAGEFAGARIVPGETYLKMTSKIKYKDEHGNINELWLKDYENISRTDEETLQVNSEDTEDQTEPTESIVDEAVEGLTKQQQETVKKAIKPLEKNVETLRSILEEAEGGY